MPNLSLLQNDFREAMANVCTPVSVVTTIANDQPHGTTVSAFASLSIEPPMVVVSLDQGSTLLSLVRATNRFGLNVLAEHQGVLAANFARRSLAGKFGEVEWVHHTGLPRLPGASAFLACEVADFVPGGDHYLLLGTVVDVALTPGRPLTYHARTFGTHAPGPA